jgi:hypothetical protein
VTRFVAHVALIVAALFAQLGNYWFTFGLWPQSWAAFVGFGLLWILIAVARDGIQKEAKGGLR